MISCKEVFCSELPSPGNIFLSSSCRTISNTRSNGLSYQFASERHSLTLQTYYNEAGGEKKAAKEKEYKLLADKLRPKSNKHNSEEKSVANSTCLAHSSLQLNEDISIRALGVRICERNNNGSTKTHDNDQATVDTLSTRKEGGNQSVGDSSSIDVASDKKHQNNIGDTAESSKYVLLIRYLQLNESDVDDDKSEQIHLDFRPIDVHATKLAVAGDDDNHSQPIIGVFVSGHDNKLHLFISTMEAIKRKVSNQEDCSTAMSEHTACFQPTRCFDTIDPSNVVFSSNNNDEDHEHYLKGKMGENPLTFSTPIMAIDTCISEANETVPPSSSNEKVNRLAISCYDGLIRILAYSVQCTSDENLIRISKLHYSTFIVDGPVATVHFGSITRNLINGNDGEEEEKISRSLFLLGGSLFGLAFLFYEVPLSTDGDSCISFTSFDGPLTIVDGLYADKEGYEDCVTAVHAMGHSILAVGTQSGRLLLFERQRSNETDARRNLDNRKKLSAEIAEKTQRISNLSSERDKIEVAICDLRQELHDNGQDDDTSDNDATSVNSGIECDEGEATDENCMSIEPSNEIEAKIDDMEQLRSRHTSSISQLQSSIDNLMSELDDVPIPPQRLDSKLMRKMHRYELLLERRLLYPIQGFGSAFCSQSGYLECYITTKQTIHVFRLLSLRMVDAVAASLERQFLSITNKP